MMQLTITLESGRSITLNEDELRTLLSFTLTESAAESSRVVRLLKYIAGLPSATEPRRTRTIE